MCVWWSVFEMRDKSSDPFLLSCQTLRIGTFCQSKLRGDGAKEPDTGLSLASSSLLFQPGQLRALHPEKEQIRGTWGTEGEATRRRNSNFWKLPWKQTKILSFTHVPPPHPPCN